MPICPQCRSHFHVGAKDQCPDCGYCLPQAEARLGYGVVDFPRVLDAAGVLSRDECTSLIQFLEKLERKIRPVALCVYLTDRGQREELAMHAHWILNHAQINHKAFGRRDRRLAIEDSKMQMSFASKDEFDDAKLHDSPRKAQRVRRFYHRLVDAYYHLFYPTPPPVEKEWMLVLVLDVQLGRACFSWGYKLDSYVSGEELAALIPCAHSSFRNKDILTGIKRVMRCVTSYVSGNATDINSMIRRDKRKHYQRQMAEAVAEAKKMDDDHPVQPTEPTAAPPSRAGSSSALNLLVFCLLAAGFAQDALAQSPPPPTLTPLPLTPPSVFAGSPATHSSFPTWSSREQQLIQTGQMSPTSAILFAQARQQPIAPSEAAPAESSLKAWRPQRPHLDGDHLVDDEQLLSDLEAQDLRRELARLNANKNYHLYICVADARGGASADASASAMLPLVVGMGEQALLIQYHIGRTPSIEIAGQGLSLGTEEMAQWQALLNQRVGAYLHPRDAMMRASGLADELLAAQSPHMRQGGVDDTLYLPKVEMNIPGVDAAKEKKEAKKSVKEHVIEQAGDWLVYLNIFLSSIICIGIYLLLRWWTRRKALLLETSVDKRLAAEFGSGVSPSVLYKEKYSKKRQQRELDDL